MEPSREPGEDLRDVFVRNAAGGRLRSSPAARNRRRGSFR
jgi:hypothetical protein